MIDIIIFIANLIISLFLAVAILQMVIKFFEEPHTPTFGEIVCIVSLIIAFIFAGPIIRIVL